MPQDDSLSKQLDIGALFASLRCTWHLIISGAFTLSVFAWIICLLITPDYRAEARILIPQHTSVPPTARGEAAPENAPVEADGLKNQIEVLTSGEVLKVVSDKLNLADIQTFSSTKITPWQHVLILLGMQSNPISLTPEEKILQKLRQNLQVFNVIGSRLIAVQYTSTSAQEAAEIVNAVAGSYIELQEAAQLQLNVDAAGLSASKIEDLRNKLEDLEKKVADYRASNGLLDSQTNSSVATRQISEIGAELARVRADRHALETRAASVRQSLDSGVEADTLPEIVASGMMLRLTERRIELNSQIADLSVTLLEAHPRIKSLRALLADIERQISSEGRKLLVSLNNEATTAKLREDQLNQVLNGVKLQAAPQVSQDVELMALESEAAAQRQLLENYLKRDHETVRRADHNDMSGDAKIFARANVPERPYYPQTLLIVGATFIAGLLLASIFVLLRQVFSGRAFVSTDSRRFASAEEIEMPVIEAATDMGFAPSSRSEPASTDRVMQRWTSPFMSGAIINTEESASDMSESSHGVKAVANRLVAANSKRVIAVSPEGDDASAATVKLLRELADRGNRVILIDMTAYGMLGRAMLDGGNRAGITELLAGERRFTDVIHTDHYSQAHIMPLGRVAPESAMRAADRLPFILDALETVYDFVVVECGASTSLQIRRIVDDAASIIMNIADPDDNRVTAAAVDMDRSGYEDVIILMDNIVHPNISYLNAPRPAA